MEQNNSIAHVPVVCRDHANELRRMARKVGHPAGDVPAAMRAAADRLDELVRRLREAEKDAERYRWLRALPKGSCHGSGMTITIAKARPDPCSWMNDSVRGDDMDAAIDAAMQSTEAGDSIQGKKK